MYFTNTLKNELTTCLKNARFEIHLIALIEIQAFWQFIAAILQQKFLAILLKRCGNTGFRMQNSIAGILAILYEFWRYCSDSDNITAILAILPETVNSSMLIYALMESNLSLKSIFYYNITFS